MERPRLRLPERVRAGDVVPVRALLMHPMESGLRLGPDGGRVPRRIVYRIACSFEGEPLLVMDLEPGIAANPYVEFAFLARRSGTLTVVYTEDGGAETAVEAFIEVEA
ncbi:thiosulfate oxidation carrier complex protein SoxZ [Mongoliimonas terrestris]|uniref:thiosulfate oxidation carrier complex protein SoxZ n=1 Tax=Mongoliimonas terrestris TaxID=1709001 RepID=UPI00094969E8|nr:thiosulfate oxidation carrier complex protein SoxZ [Mongoliimonas terrestris]